LLAGAAIMASVLLTGACSAFGIRSGTEQPSYTVVDTIDDNVEIRRYGSRLAAELVVSGDEDEARSAGFRKLAAFIFGENQARQSIAMTAPVSQAESAPVSQAESEKIAMTAPVSQTAAAAGEWRVRFFMPDSYTAETLPKPDDPDIAVRQIPAETYAVIRFSGSRAPRAVHDATAELLAAMTGGAWQVVGQPDALFYDPPWTPWFLRRNEVAIQVEPRATASSDRLD
jgi:hypothetical protein